MKSLSKERSEASRKALKTARAHGHQPDKMHWDHRQDPSKPKGFGHWHGSAVCLKCRRWLFVDQRKDAAHPPGFLLPAGIACSPCTD